MAKPYQGVIVELYVFGKMKTRKSRIQRAVEKQVAGAKVKFVRPRKIDLGDGIHLEKVEVPSIKHGPSDAGTAIILVRDLEDFLPALERRIKESKAWQRVARVPRGAKV